MYRSNWVSARVHWFFLKRINDAKGDFKYNPVLYLDTMLRYHLSIEPDTLDDEQYAQTLSILRDIREREAKTD